MSGGSKGRDVADETGAVEAPEVATPLSFLGLDFLARFFLLSLDLDLELLDDELVDELELE